MKKKRIIFYFVLFILCVIIFVASILSLSFQEFVFDEKLCDLYFGCTVKEFFNTDLDMYDEVGDFRKNAYIGKDGILHIYVTNNQEKALKQHLIDNLFYGTKITKTELSDDGMAVIGYCFNQTKVIDTENTLDVAYRLYGIHMLNRSLSDKILFGDVEIKVILKDGVTKETILEGFLYEDDLYNKIDKYFSKP